MKPKKKLNRNNPSLTIAANIDNTAAIASPDSNLAISQLKGHAPVDYSPYLKTSTKAEYELNPTTIETVKKLGEGASGTVCMVRYIPNGTILARKSVPADPDPAVHRQIIRELSFLRTCNSAHIVSFMGAYYDEEDSSIAMCMEYCQGGSFDAIYKRVFAKNMSIGEGILGKVSEAVLEGLVYLHDNRIIHRDVKPSNILVTGEGQIKLCDFGVSGELVDSMARTFVGTSYYMAPERIQGYGYAVQSDIWSLGLTICELAEGRFPFPGPGEPRLAIVELLDYIVRMPAPKLNSTKGFSKECCEFVNDCLIKDSNLRPTPANMLKSNPFVLRSKSVKLNLKQWIMEVWR
ncbi:Pkinase-domain-containing protein [Neoconidiobolus thromboides FSU 785]|nr:Pkinase-domain-containing protein [Neoconidiobolus thromboides FSU 785]